MVMTIVDGRVAHDKWALLEQAYKRTARQLPRQMIQTFLVHDTSEPTRWQIISVWHSREALEEMRRTTETPGALLIFREAGVEPTVSIFDVAAHRAAGGA